MKKDVELWKFIAKRLKQKQSVVLLVVAESSGSSPGRQGFKMVVAEDELFGSIGGGVMEVQLVELAKGKRQKAKGKNNTAIRNSQSAIIEQVHRKDAPNSSGMICSGKQTVISKKLSGGDLETVREIISALENGVNPTLQIKDSAFQVSKMPPEGGIQNSEFKFERIGENEFLYEERLGYKNELFIIGGGHCALALSELMSKLDFHITLFDDRPDLNTLAKNEFAHKKKILASYDEIGDHIQSGENVYVVVMTLGYKFDEIVVRKLFDKNFKYFGVLGSKAKMAVLLKDLAEDGFDKERLNRIYTPIGVEINSETPEEIALSIAAEIIAVKNAKG